MRARRWLIGVLVAGLGLTALAVGVLGPDRLGAVPGLAGLTGPDEPGPRPAFQLPFACGQEWRLTTYASHNPEHKKLDMYRVDGTTRGSVVRASAPGEVIWLPDPGGVKLDHGGRWNTLYLHMEEISVEIGDQVEQGDPIGRVGSIATSAAHLHYEQLFDSNGDGWARTSEMRFPVVQGEKYQLDADDEFPVVQSANNCRS